MTTEHSMIQHSLLQQGREARDAFNAHRSDYETVIAQWVDTAAFSVREADRRLRDLTHRLKLREAELLITHEFQAKNAEGRAAELLLGCQSDAEYLGIRAAHEDALAIKATAIDQITSLSNTMSMLKRSMDMELAWVRLLAIGGD